MPDEVGSGGEQVVATPAIENSLDAVQQAAFDECMRNRANQIPDELPVTTEAECLRFASQVDLTQETSGGDAKDQDLAKAARNYPNTSEGYQSFLEDGCGHGDVEDCVQAWEQAYGSRFDTRFLTPTAGFKKDGKWESHKDRPYTKKPKSVK